MSRAVVFTEYGGPEVLHVVDAEAPRPGPGQVRVRVMAAGVQPFDCLLRRGGTAGWRPAVFPQRLGQEFAGVVDAVGEGVRGVEPGAEVIGWAENACHAEHVVAEAAHLAPKPERMPWEEAGALTASGQTAATALKALGVGPGAVRSGPTVLVHAAAGGVGGYAVQLARAWGARVIGTASERNHGYLAGLGAEPVAYGAGLEERVRALAPGGVDVALDCAGTEEALRVSVSLVRDPGRIGSIAAWAHAAAYGVRLLGTERSAGQLAELTALHDRGALRIPVWKTFALDDAAKAHHEVETGHARGKVVLVVG
ncbi:NADP-dependent oxidoreductase [Sphaerisporangium aureirubrum]|uniref:NADP-dependent oxidoreductase n=1 Tax=Sphaerisporangium aureirubrum TaxID=1544736 RepID=A0ABW1NQD5_9ACTN